MPGEGYTTAPFVQPSGELYLSIQGWPKVRAVLAAIDAVDAAGVDPCDAAPDHWRHVHNRLSAGQAPRLYTAERRSEEHTSELQSLMRISYAVFCLKKTNYYYFFYYHFIFSLFTLHSF